MQRRFCPSHRQAIEQAVLLEPPGDWIRITKRACTIDPSFQKLQDTYGDNTAFKNRVYRIASAAYFA